MIKCRVYLDNCCFNRPYDDQSQMRIYLETQAKLYIQKLIYDGCLLLAISYISHYENGNNPLSKNKITIERFFEYATTFVNIDRENIIEKKAVEIMKYGVKAKDALHLSCAIEAGCDWFITTDDGILKKYISGELKVCSPVEFINIWEELL